MGKMDYNSRSSFKYNYFIQLKPGHIIFFSIETHYRINSCPTGKIRIFKIRRNEKIAHLDLQIEDLRLEPQNPHRRLAVVGHTVPTGGRDRRIPGVCWPAGLAYMVKFHTK